MSEPAKVIQEICAEFSNDRTRMMDVVEAVQKRYGCVSDEAIEAIAAALNTHRVEVESLVSFYSFLSKEPKGKFIIRLCDDIIDEMYGSERVAEAFVAELGIDFGETTADGTITLEKTPCIGLCDQAPAALINNMPVTYLSTDKVADIVKTIRETGDLKKLVHRVGDGHNGHPLVRSMVHNSIRRKGPVVLEDLKPGDALHKALAMSPVEVIRDVKTARLRGRGGAGFPTGMKWDFARAAEGEHKTVICNADEGEPGTFKDRVILTERADLVFEGMAIAGYAIGADTGILYLRGEYAYLRSYLENVLKDRRDRHLLGKAILGKDGFDFDIRIQMGAGAYVCGEETALISSCEGLRGDPKNRPPFPAQKGYLDRPTTVNNVETFCCVARILEKGPGWFAEMGSKGSPGTKLLSVSGDCSSPGVYEFPFGITLRELLAEVGAEDAQAVQMGGPSGRLVGPDQYDEIICYDKLATGGSVMVFGPERDLLQVVAKFMEFFVEESCGYCTPCRVGNVLLKKKIEEIRTGHGEESDLAYLKDLGATVKLTSRCGLGQTSPNPVLSSLENFPALYDAKCGKPEGEFLARFDIRQALAASEELTGRHSEIYQ
jgi:[NiFe] hydrogenase diaphorase moiety large subunit